LARSDEGSKTINKALETALGKTLEHFEKYSHYAAENFALLKGISKN